MGMLTHREAVGVNRRREVLATALREVGCQVFASPPYHTTGAGPLGYTGIGATWHRWNRRPPRIKAVSPAGRVVVLLWAKGISLEAARQHAAEKGFELPPTQPEVFKRLSNLWVGIYNHSGGMLHKVVLDDDRVRLELFAGEAVLE